MNHDCITDEQGKLPCACRPLRTCVDLGVCQGRHPPCSDARHSPPIVPIGLQVTRLITSNSSYYSSNGSPWAWIDSFAIRFRWVALPAALAFTLLAAAGYFSTH